MARQIKTTALIAAFLATLIALPIAAEPVSLHLSEQSLAAALREFARQTGIQIAIQSELTVGKTAPALNGKYEPTQALAALLKGTGLTAYPVNQNTYGIRESAAEPVSPKTTALAAPDIHLVQSEVSASTEMSPSKDKLEELVIDIPEILIRGSRTLNMDIKRTQDDVQPYVVFDRQAIERSQASTLEEFFKARLPMNTVSGTNSQGNSGLNGNNQSSINLRGLGTNQTLILVDGRRMPSVANLTTTGDFGQPDINGIPLAAIERIEVLPATASGIYGGGATGGVVNIILRRDYAGLDVKATYANTFHSDVASRRLEATGGFSLEGGKTNVTLIASYSDSNTLRVGERDFAERRWAKLVANDQATAYSPFSPPIGYTSNIASADGNELTLLNGPTLGSQITFVPVGYAGPASDDGLALAENAGRYNLELSNDLNGRLLSLLSSPTVKSIAVNVRREFGSRVQGFIDLSSYDNRGGGLFGSGLTDLFLPAGAENNPFVNDIFVKFPTPGLAAKETFDSKTLRAVAGTILSLPRNWMAELDYAWSRSRTEDFGSSPVSDGLFADIADGTVDIFRDMNAFPPDFASYDFQLGDYFGGPYDIIQRDATVRLAGPVFNLPAGPLVFSALVERRKEESKDAFFRSGVLEAAGLTRFFPSRSQTTTSYSLESRAPLIPQDRARTGARELELQASFRADESVTRGVPEDQIFIPPVPEVERTTNKERSSSKTVGFRYVPLRDVALRASYSTGFLPPSVNEIAALVQNSGFAAIDPKRGSQFALVFPIPITFGGNPNLSAELSESWSAGLILTPSFVPNFRMSVDYTTIRKTDEITRPTPEDLFVIEDAFPGRITRAPLTPQDEAAGYTGGRIIGVDFSRINIAHTSLETYDIKADYTLETAGAGTFTFNAIATWQPEFERQVLRTSPRLNSAGYIGGPLEWRGNAGVTWNRGPWMLGWNMQYYDSYFVYFQGSLDPITPVLQEGRDRFPNQKYHDLFARYRFNESSRFLRGFLVNTEVLLGIQNVLDKSPPLVVSSSLYGYETNGDPRLRRYSISVRKAF